MINLSINFNQDFEHIFAAYNAYKPIFPQITPLLTHSIRIILFSDNCIYFPTLHCFCRFLSTFNHYQKHPIIPKNTIFLSCVRIFIKSFSFPASLFLINQFALLLFLYTGWPIKNGMAYFPQYVAAITNISVCGNFSWEKWYQDQQVWFSSLLSRAHFVRQCRVKKFPPFSLNKMRMNAICASHSCEQ